jgi:lipoic acid synthetase
MIMGNTCTRNCAFCGVPGGLPEALEADEPMRVAEAVRTMNLHHVVITSVTRDDLPLGGAPHFARVVEAVRALEGRPSIEVLTPDFGGSREALDRILSVRPDVFNHNLETVRRLQPVIRPQASWRTSLEVLKYMADQPGMQVKSGLMVGLGESDEEVLETIEELAQTGCRLLTIGQYLLPRRDGFAVDRFVSPDVFDLYREKALKMGLAAVASGPLVRSSYHAEQLMKQARE